MLRSETTAIIVLLLIAVGGALSLNPYIPVQSIYDTGPKGVSSFYTALSDSGFTIDRFTISPFSLQKFSNGTQPIVIIVGSDRAYSQGEVQEYVNYVQKGGTVLLFEDLGPARAIAKGFGATYAPGILKEQNPDYYYGSSDKPFIVPVEASNIFGVVLPPVLLNEAVSVFDISGFLLGEAYPILSAGLYGSAFLDTNNNNIVEAVDMSGYIPLGFLKFYKQGVFATLGDASLPMNQHWNLQAQITGVTFTTSNAIYCLGLVYLLSQLANTTSILFDESHQQISYTSLTGVLSLTVGTSVAYLHTLLVQIGATIILIMIGVRPYIHKYQKKIRKEEQISTPTKLERSLTEQYILYKLMGKGFIHVHNSILYKNIQKLKFADKFITELNAIYGDIDLITSFSTLIEVHKKMRDFIDANVDKIL